MIWIDGQKVAEVWAGQRAVGRIFQGSALLWSGRAAYENPTVTDGVMTATQFMSMTKNESTLEVS